MFSKFKCFDLIKKWMADESGLAGMEATFVFPVMLTLLLGTLDLGSGILTNQKTIRASQVAADLITRMPSVNDTDIDEAVEAAKLALEPFASDNFGIDIVSISFDDDANPVIEWRETRNMTAGEGVLTSVASLAEPGGGVVMVTARFNYEPIFAGFVVDTIPMQEVAFARGRKTAVVEKE
jgi:Flp pilus assembly protein TadG